MTCLSHATALRSAGSRAYFPEETAVMCWLHLHVMMRLSVITWLLLRCWPLDDLLD